jgi:carbamoyl-phosphate synthase small subunit
MKYQKRKKALLMLEDGTIFYGKSVANKEHTAFGEICFNTGMTGYQEIFTDPSYFGQIMVLTNAHIGNYGAALDEVESDSVKIAGLVCKNFSYIYSRPHANESLETFLECNNTFAISDVDTRALVSHIREHGAQNAVISTRVDEIEALKNELKAVPSMAGLELSSKVSTTEPYFFGDADAPYKVAVLDIGVKKNILRCLAERGAYLKVFPYNTPFSEMKSWSPDGYFLSNGPGDPEPLSSTSHKAASNDPKAQQPPSYHPERPAMSK